MKKGIPFPINITENTYDPQYVDNLNWYLGQIQDFRDIALRYGPAKVIHCSKDRGDYLHQKNFKIVILRFLLCRDQVTVLLINFYFRLYLPLSFPKQSFQILGECSIAVKTNRKTLLGTTKSWPVKDIPHICIAHPYCA